MNTVCLVKKAVNELYICLIFFTLVVVLMLLVAFLDWLVFGSFGLFVISLLLLPLIIVHIPHDVLLKSKETKTRHFSLSLIVFLIRNSLGLILILFGVVMLFTPGQGLLSIFLGVMLASIPGKRKALIWLLTQPKVYRTIDRIRSNAGRASLELPKSQTHEYQ